jgi:hypothetical protein
LKHAAHGAIIVPPDEVAAVVIKLPTEQRGVEFLGRESIVGDEIGPDEFAGQAWTPTGSSAAS